MRLHPGPTWANKCWRDINKRKSDYPCKLERARHFLNTQRKKKAGLKNGAAFCLTAVGEFEGEDAALVQVELVFVGLGVVQHLHVAALHAHGEPFAGGTVAQREDLQPGRWGAVGRRIGQL